MAFLRQILLASELRQLRKELIEEKKLSLKKDVTKLNICQRIKRKWIECLLNTKRTCQKCYKCPKGTFLYKLSYNLRHEGSCENYTIKSVVGFIGGFLLTYIFFMFFVFQLNFKLSSATFICSIFGCILTIGLAFSHNVRCIVLLLLPQFFSRRGRQALLAYAFILALTGPAKNTLNNMSILSESLACGQEQLKSAIKQIIEVLKVPFFAIRDAIKKVVQAVKEVIKQIKKILLAIKRVVIALVKVIKAAFQFLRKLVSICNKELGTPFQRCTRVFENAILDCNAKLGPMFNWLCSIAYIVQNVCYIVKIFDLVCFVVDFINDSIIGVLYRKVKMFVRHIRTMFYVRIKFSHSYHFETTQSKSMKEVYAGILTEIKQRSESLMAIFDLMTCATSLFFFFIIVRVVYYRYKFLTNERFDNRFITKDFRLLDLRRAQLEKETVLPLNHREAKTYINPSSLTLVHTEKVQLSKAAFILGTATIKLSTHMVCDYSLYWVLTVIRKHARFQSKLKAPAMPEMHIEGTGFLADLLSGIVNAFKPIGIQLEIDTIPCLPDPIPPDYDRYTQIGTSLLLCWVLTLLEPYGLRLRHAVMCYYYPVRAKERTIWLYNQIMRKRSSFLKFARRQLRRKLLNDQSIEKVTCKDFIRSRIKSPVLLYCLGSEKQLACLLCGEVFKDEDRIIRCATPGCPGVYCEQCFADLQNICTVCMDPIQYGDLSDIDVERDSSEEDDRRRAEERRKKKEKKKKEKKEKKKKQKKKKGGKDHDDDDNHGGDDDDLGGAPLISVTDDEGLGLGETSSPEDTSPAETDRDASPESDYSYSYQLQKDIHASQPEFPDTTYKDLEKQRVPDYASMEAFRTDINLETDPMKHFTNIQIETQIQSAPFKEDFYDDVGGKIAEKPEQKRIEGAKYVTDYATGVETDVEGAKQESKKDEVTPIFKSKFELSSETDSPRSSLPSGDRFQSDDDRFKYLQRPQPEYERRYDSDFGRPQYEYDYQPRRGYEPRDDSTESRSRYGSRPRRGYESRDDSVESRSSYEPRPRRGYRPRDDFVECRGRYAPRPKYECDYRTNQGPIPKCPFLPKPKYVSKARSKCAPCGRNYRDEDMIPLLELDPCVEDVEDKWEPKTTLCARCRKRRKICTCKQSVSERKCKFNVPPLDLSRLEPPRPILRRPSQKLCRYCYQPYNRCYCIQECPPCRPTIPLRRICSARSVESTPCTLKDFNVNYTINNELQRPQGHIKTTTNISMNKPTNQKTRILQTIYNQPMSRGPQKMLEGACECKKPPDGSQMLPITAEDSNKSLSAIEASTNLASTSQIRESAQFETELQTGAEASSELEKKGNGNVASKLKSEETFYTQNTSLENHPASSRISKYNRKVQDYYKKINSPTETNTKNKDYKRGLSKKDAAKSVLVSKEEPSLGPTTPKNRPVSPNKNYTVAYTFNATYFDPNTPLMLMGATVSGTALTTTAEKEKVHEDADETFEEILEDTVYENLNKTVTENENKSLPRNAKKASADKVNKSLAGNAARASLENAKRTLPRNPSRTSADNAKKTLPKNTSKTFAENAHNALAENQHQVLAENTHRPLAEDTHKALAANTHRALAENTHKAVAENTHAALAENTRISLAEDANKGLVEDLEEIFIDNFEDNRNESAEEVLSEAQKIELFDSTDSEISIIDFDALLETSTPKKKVMKGKEEKRLSGHISSNIITKEDTPPTSTRYSREPAEKDENSSNIKFKKFSSPTEIKQFFQENSGDREDMNCYNYIPHECKNQCGCCNTEPNPPFDNQDYNYQENYQRNEASFTNTNHRGSQNQNFPGNYPQQAHSSNFAVHDPYVKLSKNSSQNQEQDGSKRNRQNGGYSYSSPEVMNRFKGQQQNYYNGNEYPMSKNEQGRGKYVVEESESDVAIYKKQQKKPFVKSGKPQKGCPCCNCNNYYDHDDQDSLCSEHTRSTEYMDLAYQQQGDYPNLVDELEDTITQRNKERVQRTLQHFEMISAGMKQPCPLDGNEKPSYNYEQCPCQKYKYKSQNHPCYCLKGPCQYCEKYCKIYQQQQQQQQQQKCEPHCRGNCQQGNNYQQHQSYQQHQNYQPFSCQPQGYPHHNYQQYKAGYVEKVVKNMDPNLNESVQKYPKFQNKFNNTHWRFDARSGEWIKVCERSYDYENNYPPLPPPPPSGGENLYDSGTRRISRHHEYGMPPPMQRQQDPNQETYGHHKKNCMCGNCGMHRENRRY